MAAQINFYGGTNGQYNINNGGSGVGFFGSTFGQSVLVNAYQDSTYVTDGNGTTQGATLLNWKYVHANSGLYGGDSTNYKLSGIPNSIATLNVRFTNDTAVMCQNVRLRIYDRSDTTKAASGVVTQIAELCRPDSLYTSTVTNTGPFASGSVQWTTANPTGSSTVYTPITQSPGISGSHPRSASWTDVQHDWYFLFSASPTSIGSKTQFGCQVSLEFL
jgi:hypothetical protein